MVETKIQFIDFCPDGGIGRPACRQAGALGSRVQVMFFVYVLKSKTRNYLYVGLSDNVERRISQHNAGQERTTRSYAPFECIHVEQFPTRPEARQREKYLKSGVGKEWLKRKYSL